MNKEVPVILKRAFIIFLLSLTVSFSYAQDDDLSELSELESELESLEQQDFGDESFSDDMVEDSFADEEGFFEEDLETADESAPTSEDAELDELFDEEEATPVQEQIVDDIDSFEDVEETTVENEVFESPQEQVVDLEENNQLYEEYQPDAPDLNYEKQLHQVYQDHYSQPISSSEWAGITGERIVEKYVIQAGDTLWDVSDTFFGDGFYWSKVWSLNSEIENPHIIEPGNLIKFQLGDVDDAPVFAILRKTGSSEATFVSKQA
ncbi:MAG: LysM peptidoglycan-binding domain-containing protein [Bdellovibrionales bacterium]